ncbi:prolyl oligopeptidase family serine peptidase [Microbacterium sp. NPDC089189]|uniref:S9 family peptidase n=1 Tax=Microbacterium sp. NPDC089189 TaxID=3154972 RepID=UPI00341203BA
MTATLPFGSWPSPFSADDVAEGSLRLDGARFVGDEVWWAQGVPEEGGRVAVRRRVADGVVHDVLPAPWNARSRVHEYGGGAWTATPEGTVLFVDASDQRVRRLTPGEDPVALTPADEAVSYGGLRWQAGSLLAVAEREGADRTPERSIALIPLDGSGPVTLVAGSDFVAQPALSADGRRLAWVAWDHPDMPWDRTRLRVADIGADGASNVRDLTDGSTAALQPEWADADTLLYADDPTGRWNLYRRDLTTDAVAPCAPADADTGGALWTLGMRWYTPLEDGRIVAVRTHGADELVLHDPQTGGTSPLPLEAGSSSSVEDAAGSRVLVVTASAAHPLGLWLIDADGADAPVRIVGDDLSDVAAWLPRPRAVSVDGPHGEVHAFAYPPASPDARGLDEELPPYLVWVHGGPTAHVGPAASRKVAYFTSRGIGVLDVNYGGSTGYGRAYRERLRGQWGVVDVDDVVAAAHGIAGAGLADPARLAIEGGSAGGWTVLAALVGSDVFSAGVSRYGVGDARALAADTHDFEARYLDGLIGPLPEAEALYIERSPLSHPEGFRAPLLILQGADDRVVPPSQAEAIRAALREGGVPHAYVLYEGEGHGFRRRETTVHALESELAFLGEVFGFRSDAPSLPFDVGMLSTTTTEGGPQLVIAPGPLPAHAARDLSVAVSREPERPLFARTDDPAWVPLLGAAGFTPVEGDDELFVLAPTLDGE